MHQPPYTLLVTRSSHNVQKEAASPVCSYQILIFMHQSERHFYALSVFFARETSAMSKCQGNEELFQYIYLDSSKPEYKSLMRHKHFEKYSMRLNIPKSYKTLNIYNNEVGRKTAQRIGEQ